MDESIDAMSRGDETGEEEGLRAERDSLRAERDALRAEVEALRAERLRPAAAAAGRERGSRHDLRGSHGHRRRGKISRSRWNALRRIATIALVSAIVILGAIVTAVRVSTVLESASHDGP